MSRAARTSLPDLGVALSIRPPYSALLFSGRKQVEIRRVLPARPVRCVLVYETAPTAAARGTLVIEAIDKASTSRLPSYLSVEDRRIAEQYLQGRAGSAFFMRVARAVAFEAPVQGPLVRKRLYGLQSFTYVSAAEPLGIAWLWQHLAGTSPGEQRVLSLRAAALDEARLDRELVREVSAFYGELSQGFLTTHVPRIGCAVPSIGFSSLEKMSFAIHSGGEAVGKVVVTLKRARTLKIAPVFVRPEGRGHGAALSAIRRILERARELGLRQVFTTVPRANLVAVRVFTRLGFTRCATLAAHYSPGADEDVFVAWSEAEQGAWYSPPASERATPSSPHELLATHVERYFFPIDDAWRAWLQRTQSELGNFEGKPHDILHERPGEAALIIYKRGGTAKIVPASSDGRIRQELVRAWEAAARQQGRRKVSVFLPSSWGQGDALSAYTLEARVPTYSLYEPIHVYSRWLKT